LNYVVLLCIEFVILLIEEKMMSYVTVSEGHGYPLVCYINFMLWGHGSCENRNVKSCLCVFLHAWLFKLQATRFSFFTRCECLKFEPHFISLIRVIPKVTLSSPSLWACFQPPYPLFQQYLQSNEISLNLSMKW
jgi:hypothetical protein